MTWTTDIVTDPQATGALRMAAFLQILQRSAPGRLLDLGTGHGIFARLAADQGWDVTAVDARADRFPDDPRVTWVHEDVRRVSCQGFDVIACLGLWYHLTLADQIALAGAAGGVPLILDTHFAHLRRRGHARHRKALTRLVTRDGYQGRLYSEQGLQARFTASFGNETSFWPTEVALRELLFSSGYDFVESVDPVIDVDRRFFFATSVPPERWQALDRSIGQYIPFKGSTPRRSRP